MSIELIKRNDSLLLGGSKYFNVEEVYVGAEAPTDDNYKVWINPEGDLPAEVATKGYVDEKVKEIGGLDLTGYATEDYVDEAIANVELLKGDKGDKGDTPIKGVDYFDGKDGKDGLDGEDGYTPVKGLDYWTDTDKLEIIDDVLAALPAAEEVSV